MRVAVIDDDEQAAPPAADWGRLTGRCDVDFVGRAPFEQLGGYEVIVAMRERRRFDDGAFERLPALRLLVSTGMGSAHIDLTAAAAHGVTVCGTQSRPSAPAELTWALVFELLRRAGAEDARVREGQWGGYIGTELHGRTLAVAGLGRVGSHVAAVGAALGMRVIAWSPRTPTGPGSSTDVRRVARDEFFGCADVLTLHLRLTPETRACVTGDDLRRMPCGSLLVNTSRSELIAPGALVAALAAGIPAAAAVDVFDNEPLRADEPLLGLPQVVLSGHRGYVTRENLALFYGQAVDAIEAYLAGRPVRVLG